MAISGVVGGGAARTPEMGLEREKGQMNFQNTKNFKFVEGEIIRSLHHNHKCGSLKVDREIKSGQGSVILSDHLDGGISKDFTNGKWPSSWYRTVLEEDVC
jgi:hypothetical protein